MTTAEEFINWYADNYASATNGQVEDKLDELPTDERARLRMLFNMVASHLVN